MSAPDLNDSLAQAHALHEQLASTAHGLHFACEDIALVLEAPLPPGALEPPGGEAALVRRWRRAGDLALQVARAWEAQTLPDVLPSQRTPAKDEAATVCDTAVRDLFRVTTSLANLARLADEPLRSLIGTLVDELDQAIVDVRASVVATAEPPTSGTVTVGKVRCTPPVGREFRSPQGQARSLRSRTTNGSESLTPVCGSQWSLRASRSWPSIVRSCQAQRRKRAIAPAMTQRPMREQQAPSVIHETGRHPG